MPLLLALLLLAAAPTHGMCDESAPPSTRLRTARPLRIASISGYDTYSKFDAQGRFDNETYDGQLLHHLQDKLGFTHEAVALEPGAATDTLQHYDIILTYWSQSVDRQNAYAIPAHTSNNRIVVIDQQKVRGDDESLTFSNMVKWFTKPFANYVWFTFLPLFFVNALGLYVIEWDHADFAERSVWAGLGLALYLSFSLLTGACDHRPNTSAGKLLFASFGVSVIITMAWYTGDLAASEAAAPKIMSTIDDVVNKGTVVCHPQRDALLDQIKTEAAGFNLQLFEVLETMTTNVSLLVPKYEEAMKRGDCDGFVVPEKGYDEFLRAREEAGKCIAQSYVRIEEPLVKNGAGWAVSFNVAGCVVPALEYGFQLLTFSSSTNVMLNLKQVFLKSACEHGLQEDLRVGLSQLGLIYFIYVVIFLAVCVAAAIKQYHKHCMWIPNALTPSSTASQKRLRLEHSEVVRRTNRAARFVTDGAAPKGFVRRLKHALAKVEQRCSQVRASARCSRASAKSDPRASLPPSDRRTSGASLPPSDRRTSGGSLVPIAEADVEIVSSSDAPARVE